MNNYENDKSDSGRAANTDYYPLAASAIRRVRFVTNIIDRSKLYPGEEGKSRS